MCYYFETPLGTAEILFFDGRWHAVFDGKRLGSHHCPFNAAEQLSSAYIEIGAREIDLSALHIPTDPNYWSRTVIRLPATGT